MAKPPQHRQPRERQVRPSPHATRPERAFALQRRSRSLRERDAPGHPGASVLRAQLRHRRPRRHPVGTCSLEDAQGAAQLPLPPGDHTRGGPGSQLVGCRPLDTSPWGCRGTSRDARGPDPTKPGSAATGQLGPQRGRSSVHRGGAQDAPRTSRGHLDSGQVSGGS